MQPGSFRNLRGRPSPDNSISSQAAACNPRLGECLLHSCASPGLELNTWTLNSALTLCSKQSAWKSASALVSGTLRLGISLNVYCASAFLSVCAKCLRWTVALDHFGLLPWLRIFPDVFYCATLLNVCAKSQKWQALSCLMSAMSAGWLEPDAISITAALRARRNWQISAFSYARLRAASLQADIISWSATMDACASSSRWELGLASLRGLATMRSACDTQPDICFGGTVFA